MEPQTFFLTLLAILLSARLLGEMAARVGVPAVIGELLAGVLIGPSLFGWVESSSVIQLLAKIGIILLLFEVGLETDVMRLVRTGTKPLLVAATGAAVPFAFGYAASRFLFGLDTLTALFVGGTLTATSIGITVRVLADLGRSRSPEARVVLGAAVLDDVLGVVLLALLYEFSTGGGINLASTGRVALFIALFMALAPFAAKLIAEQIERLSRTSQIPGLLPTTVVSLVLFFAWLAHLVGAPELLGGFAAGLALSRSFYLPRSVTINTDVGFTRRIDEELRPIVHLFTPIFFVSVGLMLDFRAIDWGSAFIWVFSGSLLLLALIGKIASGFAVPGENVQRRFVIGLAMVPRGEVGLIFAQLGQSSGIFNDETYAAMVIVIAGTTLLPPFIMKWYYRRSQIKLAEA
ncbi:MAG: cation:proton antiporter [Sulfurifustis sp.]